MTTLSALLMLATLAGPSLEKSRTCTSWDDAPGVLWAGRVPLSLPQIAEVAAPALWFTRDEPLLLEGIPIPAVHPCDTPSKGAVVYYQVTELIRSGPPLPLPLEDDPDAFTKIDSLILKYFFYYPRDYGLGGHVHDLEAVEFNLFLEEREGCFRVRMDSAEALAHGSRWYSNLLDIEPDTRFPLTVFVEEGKHASAFDRNADGRFTRGYDVNRQVNDAWGVRDVMGSGVLLTSAYNPEMTKPRLEAFRVFPPETPLLQVSSVRSSMQFSEDHLYRYELRRGDRVPACEDMGEDRDRLVSMMRTHGFGEDKKPNQYNHLTAGLKGAKDPQRWLSFSLRADDNLGLSLVFKGLDLTQGWVLPKVTVSGADATASLMFTPSASRFADYYIAGGVRRQYESVERTVTIDTETGPRDVVVIDPPQWNFTTEVGLKLRARIPPKARWAVLGYPFGGVRVGVQALGFGSLDDIRLIFEIGAGAW